MSGKKGEGSSSLGESNLRVFHTWTSGQVSLLAARDRCRLSLRLLRNANYDPTGGRWPRTTTFTSYEVQSTRYQLRGRR